MAQVTLGQSGSGNSHMQCRVTYTAGSGNITITQLEGCRTDGYDTASASGNVIVSIGGTQIINGHPGVITFSKNGAFTTFWSGSAGRNVSGNQTVTITFSGTGNSNIDNSIFTTTIDAGSSVTTPTLSNVSVSNIGRTTANASFTVTNNGGASIVDRYIDCAKNNFSSVVSTITAGSGTFSGLTANTKYYVRANASNGSYRGFSSVGSFTTSGNAPTVSGVATTPTKNSCSFSISVSYDTNASYSSRTIQYGTTISYGSSTTGTSISGLQPNTTYYYKVSITDNWGRTGTKTGSFTTLKDYKFRLKVNDNWKNAHPYIKVDGVWKIAEPEIKINDEWKKGY